MLIDERVRARLAATTRFADIRHLEEVDSTNRYVRDAVAANSPEGLVVVADYQTAGRGRLDRTWEAPPGAGLLVSVLLRPVDLPPARWHLLSAAASLSAREALIDTAALSPDLKWPNDLLVGDRKLAGILAESDAGAVVVGMGLNLTWAPAGAASVSETTGRPVDRAAVLEAWLEAFERWYGRWDDVAAAYRRTCATIGRPVRVETVAGTLVGLAIGIDGDGRLLVSDAAGTVTAVTVGDVVHVRAGGRTGW